MRIIGKKIAYVSQMFIAIRTQIGATFAALAGSYGADGSDTASMFPQGAEAHTRTYRRPQCGEFVTWWARNKKGQGGYMQARLGTMALLIGLGMAGLGMTTLSVAAKAQEGPPPPGYYNQPWTRVPDDYRNDIARRGYHDGMEGARRDFDNHRQPNVENRDEYRHPDVPHNERHEYQQAFRAGYQRGVENIYRGHRY